ncbi:hypothetical protein C3K47_16660 [Solitalea longa]|uniref:DUF3887 domain-containing protein n=1 Tax=Solitalea longa TaxID=2079460 RepID=A0A2S4ZXX6_9SPHI|nr:DUF6702 family protein [Solitalea longa]POY35208.1 hypothetical protein C3K47_16660 [Solitalea longa]
MKKLIFLLAMLLLFVQSASSHKFYTSMTQMQYNKSSKSVEIIMNVFWDDVEVALSKLQKKTIKVEDANFDSYLKSYLQQSFLLRNNSKQLKPFNFVGKEVKGETMSVYLEIPMPEGLNNVELTHSVLIGYFDAQTNIVNVISGNKHKTLLFKEGTTKQKISW